MKIPDLYRPSSCIFSIIRTDLGVQKSGFCKYYQEATRFHHDLLGVSPEPALSHYQAKTAAKELPEATSSLPAAMHGGKYRLFRWKSDGPIY